MTTLDNPTNLPDPSTVSIRPTAMRYGLIGGLILIVLSLIFNMTGMVDYTGQKSNLIPTLLQYGTMLVILVLAIKQHRDKELGGYITFGRCVSMGAMLGLIIGVLSGLFAALYFSVIEPGLTDTIMSQMEDRFAEQGMDENAIEMATKWTRMMFNPVAMIIWGIVGSVLAMVIFSLIVGAVMKKNPPSMA